jgi:four helix bundle protein
MVKMSATFEDLKILKSAEKIADSIWSRVSQWDEFAKDVVGKQLARSADSIGANIAVSFGRFNFGEKSNSFIIHVEVCSKQNTGLTGHKFGL